VVNLTTTLKWLRQRKHRLLLVALLLSMLMQPIATANVEVVAYFVLLAIFLTVFEKRIEQIIAVALVVPGIATNILGQFGSEGWRHFNLLAYHSLVILFLGFAVVTVLLDIFRSTRIQLDHVIGAFSGFILAALAWGNLYLLIYLIAPDSFRIEDHHADHIDDVRLRRFLFDHLSFASLTTLDHDGITPVAPFVRTLQWFEALFGQFYFAVFIGQLVGLTMVGAKPAKSDPPRIHP
jgi:hypothetical protein